LKGLCGTRGPVQLLDLKLPFDTQGPAYDSWRGRRDKDQYSQTMFSILYTYEIKTHKKYLKKERIEKKQLTL
jgi:hypothetical protein